MSRADIQIAGALSLHQPWLAAIQHRGPEAKRFENRSRVSLRVLDSWIALHSVAGEKPTRVEEILTTTHVSQRLGVGRLDRSKFPRSAITCVAFVIGVVKRGTLIAPHHLEAAHRAAFGPDNWRVGSSDGYCLGEVIDLPEPVECAGARGVWHLLPSVNALVKCQLAKLPACPPST